MKPESGVVQPYGDEDLRALAVKLAAPFPAPPVAARLPGIEHLLAQAGWPSKKNPAVSVDNPLMIAEFLIEAIEPRCATKSGGGCNHVQGLQFASRASAPAVSEESGENPG
jgi:hypothetical protein